MNTYLWQLERGINIFIIQTEDKFVADKLKRRKDAKLFGRGMNCPFWQFVIPFYSPQKARNALSNLTNRPVQKDSEEGVYFA